MGTVGKSRAKTWKKTLREKSQRQNSLVQAEVLRTREVFFFFATYVENSAPVASLSGEYEELLSQNEGKELVLFDLHLLKWDQFCISAVHYNTVYVIDNLQNGLTYKECFAQLFHFWPLKENKMIQAGRRKFQQFLSCFKCNWKKKKKVLENKESGILLPCYDTGVFMQQRMEIFVCSSSRADQKHGTNMFIKKKKKIDIIINSHYKSSDIFHRDVISFLFSFCHLQQLSAPLFEFKALPTFLIWIWSCDQTWSLHINKRKKKSVRWKILV